MNWEKLPYLVVRDILDKVTAFLNETGEVRDAYYRIHEQQQPVIYARMDGDVLGGIPVTFRSEAIEAVYELAHERRWK